MTSITRILVLGVLALAMGCGPGSTPVEQVTVPLSDQIKSDLNTIVSSRQKGSEMVTLDQNITKLAEEQPDKAAELRKGYEKLQSANGAAAASQAKKMIEEL